MSRAMAARAAASGSTPAGQGHGTQHLLSRAVWDADAVRDDVRGYVVEHLHDEAAALVVDETGDVKERTHTVAVQRQYTGTAGRIENSQVASTSSTQARANKRRWTGICMFHAPGRATWTAAGPQASTRTPSSLPSPNWPAR